MRSHRSPIRLLKNDEQEVELVNWNSSGKLGFSITGGHGSQHIRGDDGIYIKSIQEGGLVSWDGRIWVGDRLVGVKPGLDGKRIDLCNLTHEKAGEILRKFCSSKRVVLIVKKTEVILTNWSKNDHLGFSIAGGVDKEHIPGDCRIYITHIIDGGCASRDGRISVGDRLLGVKQNLKSKGMRSEDFFLMDQCTHDSAVNALQTARKGKDVVLIISKNNNVHPKLRFDDTPQEKTKYQNFVAQTPFAFGQNLLPRTTLLPHVSSNPHSSDKTTKPILKNRGFSNHYGVNKYKEGFGKHLSDKKPIRIKYISGEPITEEVQTNATKDSETNSNMDGCFHNDPTQEATNNEGDNSLITSNDISNSCTNTSFSTTNNCYDYDSALSSMSSEDETQFLDFSNLAKVLPDIKLPKPGHTRQNSKHIIEPIILKYDTQVSHFSRPPLNKDKMFSSTPSNREFSTQQTFNENSKRSHERSTEMPKGKENISQANIKYFNKRYNISTNNPSPKQDLTMNDFDQMVTNPAFNHLNTKHFVKTTRFCAL